MSGFNVVLPRNTKDAPSCGMSSQSVAFSHYNHLGAQLPIDPSSGQLVCDCASTQARQCFANLKAVVHSIDHVLSDVVRVSIFVTDMRYAARVEAAFLENFVGYKPTLTFVGVSALPMGAKVMIDAVVSNGEGTIPNAPQAGDLVKLVNSTHAAPLCHLSSQIVAFSHYSNISAQLPIDPTIGRIVPGCVRSQTAQCLKNIKAILASIDVPMDDIVKVNVFTNDIKHLDAINEVYQTFFPDSGIARAVNYLPARTMIAVKELPQDAMVMIEAVVSHGDGTPPQAVEDRHGLIIEANNTPKAPICSLSTQSVAFSHYNNISGQLPIDAKSHALVGGGIKEQTTECLSHIKAIIECVDHSLKDIVKVNVYLKCIKDMEAALEAYKGFFPEGTPALRVVEVSDLPKGALVMIDAVAGNEEGTPPVK